MRKRIKNKLKSQRGASLSFGLMLFLVCAVIGSAVLTAGTVAAGRMSRVAEMDQRFYSVNSAAKLLIDLIDGKEVKVLATVTEVTEGTNTTSTQTQYAFYRDSAVDTAPASVTLIETVTKTTDDATGITSITKSYASSDAADVTPNSFPTDAAFRMIFYEVQPAGAVKKIGEEVRSLTLAPKGTVPSGAKLDVTVTETVLPNGSMVFELSNTDDTDKYTIHLYFSPERQDFRDLKIDSGKDVTTSVIKWKLSEIKSARKEAAS